MALTPGTLNIMAYFLFIASPLADSPSYLKNFHDALERAIFQPCLSGLGKRPPSLLSDAGASSPTAEITSHITICLAWVSPLLTGLLICNNLGLMSLDKAIADLGCHGGKSIIVILRFHVIEAVDVVD